MSAPSVLTSTRNQNGSDAPEAVAVAASENHRLNSETSFLKDTYSRGSATWGATQDCRI